MNLREMLKGLIQLVVFYKQTGNEEMSRKAKELYDDLMGKTIRKAYK